MSSAKVGLNPFFQVNESNPRGGHRGPRRAGLVLIPSFRSMNPIVHGDLARQGGPDLVLIPSFRSMNPIEQGDRMEAVPMGSLNPFFQVNESN